MFLIVILRTVIDIETYPISALNKVRAPTMPAFTWDGEKWSSEGWGDLNTDLTPFFEYGNYPLTIPTDSVHYARHERDMKTMEELGISNSEYNIVTDLTGPLYFIPQQCLEKYSF